MSFWWQSTRNVYAIGRNYAAHVAELSNTVPTTPFWFLKPTSSIIPSGVPHQCPPGKSETHHEVELGVIIGACARRVSPGQAMQYVSGYCLALDMTDRAAQNQAKKDGKPWTLAKGWDTSCPVSDMVPAAAVPDPNNLSLSLRVNGEEKPRQAGSTANMIFGVAELISAVSHVHTLQVGDLILTGTPEGVGPVVPGDVITARIEELGLEINVPIVASEEPWTVPPRAD
eukprot:TRINITY_DN58218_c0_g1_i1.p1 TRINITY_DN58218_c0_g1~~TRINITY_DN58218_c0_g1_i1.p1  ORF type:complete len:257 (-),score=41.52 TRINITY_DN58218_c0_g1_i1:39-722(-)